MVDGGRKKGSLILLKLCTSIVPPKLFFYYLEFLCENFLMGLKIDIYLEISGTLVQIPLRVGGTFFVKSEEFI